MTAKEHLDVLYDECIEEFEDNLIDTLKSDDIEYVKGMMEAFFYDYLKVACEKYCLENKLPMEMAEQMQAVYDEECGDDEETYDIDYDAVQAQINALEEEKAVLEKIMKEREKKQ